MLTTQQYEVDSISRPTPFGTATDYFIAGDLQCTRYDAPTSAAVKRSRASCILNVVQSTIRRLSLAPKRAAAAVYTAAGIANSIFQRR